MADRVSKAALDMARSVGPEKIAQELALQAREMLGDGIPEDDVRAVMLTLCEKLGLDPAQVLPPLH